MNGREALIASEGLKIIAGLGLLTWALALLGYSLLSVLFLGLTVFVIYFFRDPKRDIPTDENAVVSPADGRVIMIEQAMEDDFLNTEMQRVSISLALTDCHINRYPVEGEVAGKKFIPGKFQIAHMPPGLYSKDMKRASDQNQRLATQIRTESDESFVVVQIVGFLARRIVCYAEIGDQVQKGQRFGMIRFGSRVDVYMPASCDIMCRVGERVRGGESVIAHMN